MKWITEGAQSSVKERSHFFLYLKTIDFQLFFDINKQHSFNPILSAMKLSFTFGVLALFLAVAAAKSGVTSGGDNNEGDVGGLVS